VPRSSLETQIGDDKLKKRVFWLKKRWLVGREEQHQNSQQKTFTILIAAKNQLART
jgi:hypothetical protein